MIIEILDDAGKKHLINIKQIVDIKFNGVVEILLNTGTKIKTLESITEIRKKINYVRSITKDKG